MVSLTLSIFAHFLPIFASKLHPAPSHPSNLIVQTYLHLILFTLQPIYNSYSRHLVLRDRPFDTLAYFTPQPFYNSSHFTLRGFDIPSLHQRRGVGIFHICVNRILYLYCVWIQTNILQIWNKERKLKF